MFQDVMRVVQAYAMKVVRLPGATEVTPEQEKAAKAVIKALTQGAKTERPKHLARPAQRPSGVRRRYPSPCSNLTCAASHMGSRSVVGLSWQVGVAVPPVLMRKHSASHN
jgi:hypothetical protein